MKNKILILAWGVYPGTGGSTIILNNIAKGFKADELVIAGQIPRTKPEVPWDSFSDIKLYYLDPFPFGYKRPERYIRWLKTSKLIRQVEEIVKSEGVTSILSIFPDEYYAYIAYKVSKRLDLPFYIWYHNSYVENRTGILKVLAKYLQPKFFKLAKKVFVMSDGLNKELSLHNPNVNFETLVHGFELELPQAQDSTSRNGRTKFLYSGSLNDSCLDASIRMIKVILEDKSHEIHVFSGNPKIFIQNGLDGDRVFFHDFLPLQDFVASLHEYDIMMLPHGIDGKRSQLEYKTIFPTRTIPLLFSGKPILAHSPEDSFLTEFLKENDCAVIVCDKDKEKLRTAIEQIKNGDEGIDELVKNAQNTSKLFELQSVIDRMKSLMHLN